MVRGAEIDSDEPSARGRCRVGRLVRALCGCMLVLLLTWPAAVVAGDLHIDRLVGAVPEANPAPEALEALDWEAQPGRAAIDRGTRWWRVQVQPPQPPDQRWVLALREVFDGRLVVYRPPHYRPEPLEVFDRDAPVIGSRHRLAVELEAGSLEQPVYLEVVESRSQPIGVRALPAPAYLEADRGRVRFTSAVLAASLLLGLVSAIFAVILRRRAHGLLAIWVFSGVVYFGVFSGEAMMLWPGPVSGPVALQVASVVANAGMLAAFAALYLFLGIRQHFPRLARVYRALLWGVALLLAAGLLFPGAWLASWLNLLLLVLAAITLVVAAALTRERGNQAWFYLLGWGGVTLVVMARAGYFLAGQGTPGWLEYAHPAMHVAGALVLVLAAALAARHAEREMHSARRRAATDALTGLPNRAMLDEQLAVLAHGAARAGRPLSALFVDLDHFKALNDTHGHAFGDECLRHVAGVLRRHLRRHDLIARYGGEEFVVVLEEDLTGARRVAHGLRQAVKDEGARVAGMQVNLSASIGLARRAPGEPLARLLQRADNALYKAKGDGRDRVVCAPDPHQPEPTGRTVRDETVC